MQKLKKWADARPYFNPLIFVLTFLFPALAFAQIFLSWHSPINPYCLMWVSFYSCLLLWFAKSRIFFPLTSALINLIFFGILFFVSLMGGLHGVFLFLFCLIVPVVPLFFLF